MNSKELRGAMKQDYLMAPTLTLYVLFSLEMMLATNYDSYSFTG